MNTQNTEFEQFIKWFGALKSIPLQTRHDFLAHVLEQNKFDKKSIKFLEDTFTRLEQESDTRVSQWKAMIRSVQNAKEIQKHSEGSLTKKISGAIVDWMNEKSLAFKQLVSSKEGKILKREEFSEQQQDQNQVAALKTSLGA